MAGVEGIHDMKYQKPVIFCCLGILSCFYLHVVYLVLHPKVTEPYRLYYIDKKLLNWSNGAGLLYRVGDVIDFSKPVPYLSRKGWSVAESWGTWSQGRVSELYLQIVDGNQPETIIIFGHPFLSPQHGLTSQKLDVYINDTKIGSKIFTSEGEARFEIPGASVNEVDRILCLRFEYSNPKSPKELGLSSDDRVLGFGFAQLAVR
jgi:hypothetical protein